MSILCSQGLGLPAQLLLDKNSRKSQEGDDREPDTKAQFMMYVFMHMYAFECVCKCMCMHMCGFLCVHKNASGVQNTNYKKKGFGVLSATAFIVPENAFQQEGNKRKGEDEKHWGERRRHRAGPL